MEIFNNKIRLNLMILRSISNNVGSLSNKVNDLAIIEVIINSYTQKTLNLMQDFFNSIYFLLEFYHFSHDAATFDLF